MNSLDDNKKIYSEYDIKLSDVSCNPQLYLLGLLHLNVNNKKQMHLDKFERCFNRNSTNEYEKNIKELKKIKYIKIKTLKGKGAKLIKLRPEGERYLEKQIRTLHNKKFLENAKQIIKKFFGFVWKNSEHYMIKNCFFTILLIIFIVVLTIMFGKEVAKDILSVVIEEYTKRHLPLKLI